MSQESRGQLGPQHRTAVALGLVIGIVLGAIGAGTAVYIMTRGSDTAKVSAVTLDARAACDLLDRTSNDELVKASKAGSKDDAAWLPMYRISSAANLAMGVAAVDPAYQPLTDALQRGYSGYQAHFAWTPQDLGALDQARDFCAAH